MAEKSDTANELVRVQSLRWQQWKQNILMSYEENMMIVIEAQQNERQTDDLIGFGVS